MHREPLSFDQLAEPAAIASSRLVLVQGELFFIEAISHAGSTRSF
jgi:hypothetical protein